MKSNTDQELVELRQDLNDRSVGLDEFSKVFLLKKLFRDRPFLHLKDHGCISDTLFRLEGVRIESDDIASLLRQYDAFFYPPYGRSLIISAFVAAALSYYSFDSIWSAGIGVLVLMPYIFVIVSSLVVAQRLFKLDVSTLLPRRGSSGAGLPGVSIVIASRHEPFNVAKMTFDSAIDLEYPEGGKEIIVVDNSDRGHQDYVSWRSYVESFGENGIFRKSGLRVVFIHREGTEGYKPRNLDIALSHVRLETVLYLDVDSTLMEDSLLRALPLFQWDSKLAFVQLHALPSNAKFKSKLSTYHALQNYFLRFGTAYLANTSHALFYGHNAIWRTSVLREIGDSLEYHRGEPVVAEDLSMTLRASFKGYYGSGAWVYSGEWVPESLRESESMWLRWTVGTFQVFSRHRQGIKQLKNTRPIECTGWLHHCGSLVAYGLAPCFFAIGVALNVPLLMFLAVLSMVPEIINAVYAVAKLPLGGMSTIQKIRYCYGGSVVLGSFLNWVRLKGLCRYIVGQKQGWVPTGKSSSGSISWVAVAKERWGFILYGAWCLSWSAFWLGSGAPGIFQSILLSLAGLHGLNSLVALGVFGKSTMCDEPVSSKETGTVHEVIDYFK